MGSLKEALGLGLELSGFIFVSYYIHKPLALSMGCDDNITLAVLISLCLVLWIFHVYIALERKK